jgi:hypothetical protein
VETLKQLAASLKPLERTLVLEADAPSSLSTRDIVPNDYIWPNLVEWEDERGSRIILIEAPGAVGKSAAALALAASLRWPLIDASRAQVGSYSLSGLLQDALGFNSPFIGEVMSGRAGVIIDALDEAHLRAGTANFLAFLENVRKISGEPGGATNIVLFSRPDTAVIVQEYFKESSCPFTRCKVDFFDYMQARDYVRSYMNRQHEQFPDRNYDAPEKFPVPFDNLLSQRMNEVSNTLLTTDKTFAEDAWDQVKEFLGYAPVLSVLGEFLAVKNPFAESKAINARSGNARSILLRIISDLLDREQLKFRNQVGKKLLSALPADATWESFEAIYSPAEQSVRLVQRVLRLDFAVPVPATLPIEIRESYDKDALQWTADHPFLAGAGAVNVVFSDFIMASAAVDRTCRLSLSPDPRSSLTRVGPFFYQFVHEFGRDDDSDTEDASVPEGLVSTVLESHGQSASGGEWARFTLLQTDGGAKLSLRDTLTRSGSLLDFNVTDLSGGLSFPRRLTQGVVVTDAGVILGTRGGQRFLFGPGAFVFAKEVVIEAEIMSVDPGPNGSEVSLLAGDEIIVAGPLSVEAPKKDCFVVRSDNVVPALRPYLATAFGARPFADYGKLMDLRAIMLAFRGVLGDDPGVFGELLEKRIIKSNPIRRRYLNRLQELKLVYSAQSHYYLNTSRLASHGVTFSDMSKGQLTQPISDFLRLLDAD